MGFFKKEPTMVEKNKIPTIGRKHNKQTSL